MTLSISGQAYIAMALLLLTLPLHWVLAAMVAAVWHEACHALAVVACGGKLLSLDITWGGARMQTSPLSPRQALLCALVGPAGSLLLLFTAPWIPRIALCGLAQGVFNLLPVYPLDGGQILRCLIPGWGQRGENICLLLLLVAALWGAVTGGWDTLPAAMVALLWLPRKKPCKSSRFRVQ